MSGDKRHLRFGPAELERFLEAVNARLTGPIGLVLIGGGAAAIGYGVDTGTSDIDTFNSLTREARDAAKKARQDTSLGIPIRPAGVADVPLDYEKRLVRVMPHLRHLTLHVLDKHDLALSKIVRGYEHDFEQIDSLHQRDPLDRDLLVERFMDEMGQAIGRPEIIALAFLECMERLFGEPARVSAEKRLRAADRLG